MSRRGDAQGRLLDPWMDPDDVRALIDDLKTNVLGKPSGEPGEVTARQKAAAAFALDIVGFWALWRLFRSQGTKKDAVPARFEKLGMPTGTAYRHLASFRRVTDCHWPDHIELATLLERLADRREDQLAG